MSAAVALVARCPVCSLTVPGLPWREHGDKLIRLDVHLCTVAYLGWCTGSRAGMRPGWGMR